MPLRVLSYNILYGGQERLPHIAPGYTYQPPEPWLRLHYIFTSPQLSRRLQACDVVVDAEAAVATDHFPVWAEFCDGA